MKIFLYLVFTFTIIHCAYTQNLIPNPSFEKITTKTDGSICSSREDFNNKIIHWFSPTNVSPDIYKLQKNNSSLPKEFQLPKPIHGQCLAGIITDYYYNVCKTYKEYISVRLKDTLSDHEIYTVEFWVTAQKTDKYSIGLFFDEENLNLDQCSMLELPAQFMIEDTIIQNEWKKLSFEFKPQKPYLYLTVGNFKRNTNAKHQYLYLDNFQLIKKPTEIKKNESQDQSVVIEQIFNPQNILFEHAKYDLLTSSFLELDKLVEYLKDKNQECLTIEGHTDNSGTDFFNQELSINRASTIKKYLAKKGIESSRITIVGYGQSRPITTNETEAGRKLNRRVTFRLRHNKK